MGWVGGGGGGVGVGGGGTHPGFKYVTTAKGLRKKNDGCTVWL